MTELSPDARALIEQARRQGPGLMGPSARDRARLREKLAPGWSETSAPRASAFAWSRRLQVASCLVLIAGLGWLGWFLQSPPTSDTVERAGAAPPSAASAAMPAAAPSVEPALATPTLTPTAEPVQEQQSAALSGHLPGKRSAGAHGRARAAAPGQAGKNKGHAREQAAEPSQAAAVGGASQVHAPAKLGQAEPKERNLDEAARSTDDAARPDHRSDDTGPVRSMADVEQSLTAAADDSRTRAVKTDTRPGPRSIEGELELLGEAQAALQAQRPSRALNLLQEHAFRFPAGALLDERMAMQALALCALDRKNAAASVLSSLDARGSRSALLPRVRRQCGL